MLFSSAVFLSVFLPVVLLGTFILRQEFRNLFLLLASLFFYAWGETFFVVIMLGSIGLNYLVGLALGRLSREDRRAQMVLALGIAGNLLLLLYFKYANFLVDNWNALASMLGAGMVELETVHLPLGISFFTFQAISYLVDVYRREAEYERNLVNVALYIALFPQLIAGPIVRFHDVANPLGAVADEIFGISGGDLTTPVAW